jgi:hypothetical protein
MVSGAGDPRGRTWGLQSGVASEQFSPLSSAKKFKLAFGFGDSSMIMGWGAALSRVVGMTCGVVSPSLRDHTVARDLDREEIRQQVPSARHMHLEKFVLRGVTVVPALTLRARVNA